MVGIGGYTQPGFGPVGDAFRANFESRNEVGAACCVVVDGEIVVDLWGGSLDAKRSNPWRHDTLVTMFSTTKGMAATAMAVAHSRGLFDLSERVSTYWPEFAHGGKEHITVEQLLRHEAGLAVIDTKLTLDMIADFDRFGTILARQKPSWQPGTQRGYHAQSLGWYESQLLSRIDPRKRQIGQFFADEVAAILDVEFHIGLPVEVDPHRIATFIGGTRLGQMRHVRDVPWPVLRRLMNPRSETFKAFTNPRAITNFRTSTSENCSRLNCPRSTALALPAPSQRCTAIWPRAEFGSTSATTRYVASSIQ